MRYISIFAFVRIGRQRPRSSFASPTYLTPTRLPIISSDVSGPAVIVPCQKIRTEYHHMREDVSYFESHVPHPHGQGYSSSWVSAHGYCGRRSGCVTVSVSIHRFRTSLRLGLYSASSSSHQNPEYSILIRTSPTPGVGTGKSCRISSVASGLGVSSHATVWVLGIVMALGLTFFKARKGYRRWKRFRKS
jgi:hypothetical protein